MTPFTIVKHREGFWTLRQGLVTFDQVCWDEMLGLVARMLLNGTKLTRAYWRPYEPLPPIEYELRVSYCCPYSGSKWWGDCWSLVRGDQFVGWLCATEMLGFIAAYTLTDGEKQLFRGMRTYEQWLECEGMRPRYQPVAGLLTFQGGAA